ncbi:MAG: FkbM family methyltransferase, partial [Pseudomonadota bacterium]|nr:FkbM family methyltransferase [Pseudomonadota bacterium]
MFQNLCANIALSGPCHVRTVNGAVGNRQGPVSLPTLEHTKPGTFSAHGIGSCEDGDTTGVLQLDDAVKVSCCKFMKIDVEGMEANVIRGARDVIRRCRPVHYVENDRQEKSPELIRL